MIPVELEIKNFLAYRDPGPLLFEGIHVACLAGPNGAGKSSLLDAITWSLWGKARSNSADDLIHQGEDEMRVALTFDQGGERYQVLRQRKAGKRGASLLEFQHWDDEVSSWRSLSESTMRQTQEVIDSMLRLDFETFTNSAFLVQGKADEFTTKAPAQRKQVLSNILGLSVWELYEKRAKGRIADINAEIQRIEGRLEEVERELGRREEFEKELERTEVAAAEAEEVLAIAEKKWADLEQTRKDLVAQQRQVDDLTRRIVDTEKELAEAQTDLEEAAARADKKSIEDSLKQEQARMVQRKSSQTQLDTQQAEKSSLAEEAARLRGTNEALGPHTEPVKERLSTLETVSEAVCPTCGQPLTDKHRKTLVRDLQEEIDRNREAYKENRESVVEIENHIQTLDEAIQQTQLELESTAEVEKRVGELEAMLKHAGEAQKQLAALEKKIGRWQKELKVDLKERETIEADASKSERLLKSASLTQEDIDRMRVEKRHADERVGGARQRISALESREKQQKDLRADRTEAANELGLFQELREAFGKRGVPAMIIETIVPELERSANELLTRMTDGRLHVRIETQRETKTGETREALDIIISDELGSRPYELYSGGEAFRINFAIRIALSRLLANRAGAQLRSLFIDEGFGTQDTVGREHLLEAINSVQDDFDRILVITHIDELKETFPTRIEVQKTSSGSVFSFA